MTDESIQSRGEAPVVSLGQGEFRRDYTAGDLGVLGEREAEVTRHEVLDAMEEFGGGFVRHLAAAWRRADEDNFRRLKAAFPHYWDQYTAVAQQQRARAQERRARAAGKAGA